MEIKTACKPNPQGIASSISMNNLYAETAVELVRTYRLLKKVVWQEKAKAICSMEQKEQKYYGN